jgi:thiol-disulfide isomerase/thioredoxin
LCLGALVAAGCRCSSDDSSPAQQTEEPAAGDVEGEGQQAEGEAPEAPVTSATSAGPPAPPGALEEVTAEALIEKLKASGRKGTLVNAWASFCGPCKREVPMLEGLAKKLRPKGIDVVLVSVDEPADRAKAEAWLKERNVALVSYLAAPPLGAFKAGMNPRWPGMLPASFLFDQTGTLRYFWGGEAFVDEVEPVLEAFIAGKPMDGESSPDVARENAQ